MTDNNIPSVLPYIVAIILVLLLIFYPGRADAQSTGYFFPNGNQQTDCPAQGPGYEGYIFPTTYQSHKAQVFSNLSVTGSPSYLVVALNECEFALLTTNSPDHDDPDGRLRLISVAGQHRLYPAVGYSLVETRIRPARPGHGSEPQETGYVGWTAVGNSTTLASQYFTFDTIANLSGIVYGKNLNYTTSYQGLIVPLAPPDDVSTINSPAGTFLTQGFVSCSTWDIICHLQNLFTGFVNLFKYVFIPDSDAIAYQFNELKTQMEETLGFLLFPFQLLAQLGTAVTGVQSSADGTGMLINFNGTLFGRDITGIGVPATHAYSTDGIGQLFSLARTFALVGITFALVSTAFNKYRRLLTS